jgi:Bacterial antitoxin of type II TA system, VapB
MKTTIDIPEDTLERVMRYTRAKTKRDAVLQALDAFNRQQLLREVTGSFGSWHICSNEELEAGDQAELHRRAPR